MRIGDYVSQYVKPDEIDEFNHQLHTWDETANRDTFYDKDVLYNIHKTAVEIAEVDKLCQ